MGTLGVATTSPNCNVAGSIEWSRLRDNRDFSVLPDWEPGDVNVRRAELAKRSFQELVCCIAVVVVNMN